LRDIRKEQLNLLGHLLEKNGAAEQGREML